MAKKLRNTFNPLLDKRLDSEVIAAAVLAQLPSAETADEDCQQRLRVNSAMAAQLEGLAHETARTGNRLVSPAPADSQPRSR